MQLIKIYISLYQLTSYQLTEVPGSMDLGTVVAGHLEQELAMHVLNPRERFWMLF